MILNKDRAFVYVMNELKRFGHKINRVHHLNKERHRLVKTDQDNFYIIYKREFFLTFNKQFPEYSQHNPTGYGESINEEYLNLALNNSALLLYVYPDGKIYYIHPKVIYKICKEFNLIRSQERVNTYKATDFSGNRERIQEVTYSFPLRLMSRYS